MAFPPIPVQVTCPQCQVPFTAEIRNIVDVGADPELKTSLLRGELNVVQCPKCEFRGTMSVPLLYHDPEKELAFVVMSQDAKLPHDEQEKAIGGLVNAILDSLPSEQRKGYLLQPRTLFTHQRLVEEILQADGISKETIEAQRKAITLIHELLSALDEEDRFSSLTTEHKDELSYDFFLLLSAMIEDAKSEGQDEHAASLEKLRGRLLEKTGGVGARPGAATRTVTSEEFVQKLSEAGDAELDSVVIANAHALDYSFFLQLSQMIETAQTAGDNEKAEGLTELRTRLLDTLDSIEKSVKEARERVSSTIDRLRSEEDWRSIAQDHVSDYDTLFFTMLAAAIDQAERESNAELADQLREIEDHTAQLVEQRLPPEVRLANRLMAVQRSEDIDEILRDNESLLNAAFLSTLGGMAANMEASGAPAMAKHLRGVKARAIRSQEGDHAEGARSTDAPPAASTSDG